MAKIMEIEVHKVGTTPSLRLRFWFCRATSRKPTKERPSLELITNFTPQTTNKMRFQAPQLGALGVTFTAMRACQFATLIAIVGLCANFINEITTAERNPPSELIGAITVATIAVVYVVIAYILYYDNMLPLLATCVLDSLLLIASIVVASVIGKPLSMLNCAALPSISNSATTTFWTSIPYSSVSEAVNKAVSYFTFVAVDQATCYEIKAVWGLAIALCVLFAFSGLVCVGLWHRARRDAGGFPAGKDVEGC
ncbi:hypothetical protein QBC46DRAFT_367679 [Diplogelasinospora grovesii]|uniref:MARVEL domain-containing protein n=1 Tax=Diplogelasinospora grovesii TaxID=303347 RepID=A0AAN6RZV0_9PEZI|nr:hypothetical protein QBC46DRAFT_367679 [Diplogelasinospora grovesii]